MPLQSPTKDLTPSFLPMPRLSARLRRSGHVFVEGQGTGFACAIASISADGAVITAQGWLGVPDRFELLIKPDGVRHACVVKARRGNILTVAFEVPADLKR